MESSKFIGLIKSTEFEKYIATLYGEYFKNKKCTKIFAFFQDYFEIGCSYLINNYGIIKPLLIDFGLSNSCPETGNNCADDTCIDDDKYYVEYFKKNPTHVTIFDIVIHKYIDEFDILVALLYKYKELSLKLLKSFNDNSTEQVNVLKEQEQVNVSKNQASLPNEKVYVSKKQKIPESKEQKIPESKEQKIPESKEQKIPRKFPQIDAIEEMIKSKNLIIEHTNEHPFDDTLITSGETNDNVFIIGSMALDKYTDLFANHIRLGLSDWNSPNTTVFFLNCSEVKSIRLSGLQLFYTKFKTIEEALLSISIPCCRVAMDQHGKFYATVQAVASILGNPVIMPAYTSGDDSDLFARFMKYTNEYKLSKYLTNLEYSNIRSWVSIGFKFKYIKTDNDMEFIKHTNY